MGGNRQWRLDYAYTKYINPRDGGAIDISEMPISAEDISIPAMGGNRMQPY